MKRAKIRIVSPGTGIGTTVEINGVPVENSLISVQFATDVNSPSRVTLEFYADVEIEGEADIVKEWRAARASEEEQS